MMDQIYFSHKRLHDLAEARTKLEVLIFLVIKGNIGAQCRDTC